MLSVVMLNGIIVSFVMLNAECRYAEWHNGKHCHAEC
jgi:hypothetical protein